MIQELKCVVDVIKPVNNAVVQGTLVVRNVIQVEPYLIINAHAILLLMMMV